MQSVSNSGFEEEIFGEIDTLGSCVNASWSCLYDTGAISEPEKFLAQIGKFDFLKPFSLIKLLLSREDAEPSLVDLIFDTCGWGKRLRQNKGQRC
jgi:hypothetical protein